MNVALIGYGQWAKILERYIEASDSFNLKLIYSRSIANHEKGTNNLKDTFSNSIEAVFLALPPHLLAEYTKIYLDAGKHVFCEKPLSSNPESTKNLFFLAKQKGLILHVNYIYIHSPSINFLKDKIQQIGKIRYVDCHFTQFGKFYANQNSIETVGCHLLSAYFYITDTKVSSYKIQFINNYKKNHLVVSLIEKDMRADFKANLVCPEKNRTIQIIGEKGMLYFSSLNKITAEFYLIDKDGLFQAVESKSFDEGNNLINAIKAFKESIDANKYITEGISYSVSYILNKTKS